MTSAPRSRWYSSFYWRIGISFVVLVVVVLAAQGIMVSYLMARSERGAFRPPKVIAAEIAADVGAVLAHEPGADVTPVLQRRRDVFPRVYVVLRDGRAFASTAQPIPDDIRSDAQAVLSGTVPGRTDGQPRITGPVVSAPIQVSNELTGLVVMPPPPRGGILSDVGRLLSLPGTLILIIATAVAAIVIFAPARRRLRSLEAAAESFGSGNLAARAPESGSDEIARVAHAFNRMAADLAARDEALRTSDRLRRQMFADVSHELKTPLTAMLGYLDTLQMPEMQIDAETRRRYLATVRQETHRLERRSGICSISRGMRAASARSRCASSPSNASSTPSFVGMSVRRRKGRSHSLPTSIRLPIRSSATRIASSR